MSFTQFNADCCAMTFQTDLTSFLSFYLIASKPTYVTLRFCVYLWNTVYTHICASHHCLTIMNVLQIFITSLFWLVFVSCVCHYQKVAKSVHIFPAVVCFFCVFCGNIDLCLSHLQQREHLHHQVLFLPFSVVKITLCKKEKGSDKGKYVVSRYKVK